MFVRCLVNIYPVFRSFLPIKFFVQITLLDNHHAGRSNTELFDSYIF
jgi:hypothetical protein